MNIRVIGNKDAFSKYMAGNSAVYLFIMIVFLVGIIVGTFYYKNLDNREETSKYLEEIIEKIQGIQSDDIFQKSLVKNMGIALLFWILGASIIGIPILVIFVAYRGFIIGFTISSILANYGVIKGNLVSFSLLFFQNIFMLFAIIISLSSGIKLAINLISRKKDIKIELIRHTIICAICLIVFMFSTISETLLNGHFLSYLLDKIQ